MDPTFGGDPVALLTELIDLLRAIKDSGYAGKTAAAIGAVQHIAARSKAGIDSIVPIASITRSPSLDDLISSIDGPRSLDNGAAPDSHFSPSESRTAHVAGRADSETDTAACITACLSSSSDAPSRPEVNAHSPVTADARPFSSSALEISHIPVSPPDDDLAQSPDPPAHDTHRTAPARPKATSRDEGVKPGVSAKPESAPRRPRNLIVCTSAKFAPAHEPHEAQWPA